MTARKPKYLCQGREGHLYYSKKAVDFEFLGALWKVGFCLNAFSSEVT